jgi:hypothetical protein
VWGSWLAGCGKLHPRSGEGWGGVAPDMHLCPRVWIGLCVRRLRQRRLYADDTDTKNAATEASKPDLVDAYTNLGVALTKTQRLDEAAAQFRKAVELDPKSLEAHYDLMGIYLARQDFANARAEMRVYQQLGGRIDPRVAAQLAGRSTTGGGKQ